MNTIMVRINNDVKFKDSNNPNVDSMFDESIIEYKAGISDVRVLQSAIMTLAKSLDQNKNLSGILILDEPRISKMRLIDEWENWQGLFQPFIIRNLHMLVFSKGLIVEKFGNFTPKQIELLSVIQKVQKKAVQISCQTYQF